MKEKWKPIPNAPNYYASNIGRVKSVIKMVNGRIRDRVLTPRTDKKGYSRVKINFNGKSTWAAISRCVALSFIPNPENKTQVNHKDGIKSNNKLENLEWSTNAENVRHAFLNKLNTPLRGEKSPNAKLNENKVYAARLMFSLRKATYEELAKIFSVSKSTISSAINNKNWKND
jgi:hypothetical protein